MPKQIAEDNEVTKDFAISLLKWAEIHGRHDLPWQQSPTPYRVWVSEIMLQQTQVTTVISYYLNFLSHFPTLEKLAQANQDEVLSCWSGLGYYARARNLHKTAKLLIEQFNGVFPKTIYGLEQLPGIGRSTAGAILSLSMQTYAPILDGNCKRVFARYKRIKGHSSTATTLKKLWQLAETVTPEKSFAKFNQAMMDLGSSICTRTKPKCLEDITNCPLSSSCAAFYHQETEQFPEKKVKKSLATKKAYFILIKNEQNQIILEKREDKGIWGGLWSLPQYELKQDINTWIKTSSYECDYIKESKPQQHTFSHYKLEYITQYYLLNNKQQRFIKGHQVNEFGAQYTNKQWYFIDEALQLGLPTPIKKLLIEFKKDNQDDS